MGGKMSYSRLRGLLTLAESEPALHKWLTVAIRDWRAGERLDEAMGLTGSSAQQGRNALIRLAANLLPSNMSVWHRAGWLSKRLKLPDKNDGHPLDSLLRSIRKTAKYHRSLTSQSKIYALLTEANRNDTKVLGLMLPPSTICHGEDSDD